jgi:FkbM family methyltransferase
VLSSRPGDFNSFLEIFNLKEYEKLQDLINSADRKPTVMVDLGANIGLAFVYFKSFLKIREYIAVEPQPENLRLLGFNTASPFSRIIPKAVWTHEKGVQFSTQNPSNANYVTDEGGAKVPTSTLEKIFTEAPEASILLKMDIEGAEYPVLKQNIQLIRERVDFFVIEFHKISQKDYPHLLSVLQEYFHVIEDVKQATDCALVFGVAHGRINRSMLK